MGTREEGGEDFKGREKATKRWSDMGRWVTERAEVPQDLVNIRSSCSRPCLWGEKGRVSTVAKKLVIHRPVAICNKSINCAIN